LIIVFTAIGVAIAADTTTKYFYNGKEWTGTCATGLK